MVITHCPWVSIVVIGTSIHLINPSARAFWVGLDSSSPSAPHQKLAFLKCLLYMCTGIFFYSVLIYWASSILSWTPKYIFIKHLVWKVGFSSQPRWLSRGREKMSKGITEKVVPSGFWRMNRSFPGEEDRGRCSRHQRDGLEVALGSPAIIRKEKGDLPQWSSD